MKAKKERGITLIALVITIIVLLILAGVSIAMLTGQNGILNQASNSKEATTQAQVEEMVSLAIGSLQTENLGDTSKITPQMLADQVNEENNRTDVTAEGSSFPTNIVFAKENLKVPVDINLKVGSSTEDEELPLYSVEVEESEIAPQEIFNIETEDGKVASITDTSLPTKTAKITGMKPEYCNNIDGIEGIENTNYEINYKGTIISDTLIIPYKVEVEGEWYIVTEVSLNVQYRDVGSYVNAGMSSLPQVNTIIYPNTVTSIISEDNDGVARTGGPSTVILSENTTEIPDNMFMGGNLTSIEIPEKVTKIGNRAFGFCDSIEEIKLSSNVTEIDDAAFWGMKNLKRIEVDDNNQEYCDEDGILFNKDKTKLIRYPSVKSSEYRIPDGVEIIGEAAFNACSTLISLTIPSSVNTIGEWSFFRM